jgi:diadenosine tetraphosphate (Ap4A) HIT family hydrolase
MVAFFPDEPAVLGHVLVIPVRHVELVYDLDASTAGALAFATVRVARAVRDTFAPAGMNIVQSNGPAATQTVPHVHVHVVPRNEQDAIGDFWPETGVSDSAVLDAARSDLASRLDLGD